MPKTGDRQHTRPWMQPYDPADSPGPIPSVLDSFRWPPPPGQPRPTQAEIEAARYTIVLVPPDAAEALGRDRTDVGLRIYHDGYRDETRSIWRKQPTTSRKRAARRSPWSSTAPT